MMCKGFSPRQAYGWEGLQDGSEITFKAIIQAVGFPDESRVGDPAVARGDPGFSRTNTGQVGGSLSSEKHKRKAWQRGPDDPARSVRQNAEPSVCNGGLSNAAEWKMALSRNL